MNTVTLKRSYHPALDGLRGIAIILVLCCHNFNFIPYFDFGWIGVDLFFVLSGYLITDTLLQTRSNKNYFQNFYIRRILRIFPLYYGVLLLYFILAPQFQQLDVQYSYYRQHEMMSWLHLQNWMYIFNRKPDDFLLLNHFWSLSVEEQFYLLWPIAVIAVRKVKRLAYIIYALLAICILARVFSWLFFGDGYTNFYFQYMTRLDGLCMGALIATWRFINPESTLRNMRRIAVLLLGLHLLIFMLARFIIFGLPHFRFLGYTSIAVLFGLIVFSAINKRSGILIRLLGNSTLRYIGKISYGLYVFHWPILTCSKIYLLNRLTNLGLSQHASYVALSIASLIVAIALSILSYHFFELKLLRLKDVMTGEGYFSRMKARFLLMFRPASQR